MKKKYNKPLFIDTCILSNLLGFDDGKSKETSFKFEEKCNKKILEKYIRHHGYMMSDYNLYEILRRDNWDTEKVAYKLNRLNYKSKQKLESIKPEFRKLKDKIPTRDRVKKYTEQVFFNIVEFASGYYSSILLFPFYFNLSTLLFQFYKFDISYDNELISKKTDEMAVIVSDKIKKEFLKYGKYTKTIFEKVINKYFLILNHLIIAWYNDKMFPFYKKYEAENYRNAQEEIFELLEVFKIALLDFDYNEEIVRSDETRNAKSTDTIMFPIAKTLLKLNNSLYNEGNLQNSFAFIVDKIVFPIYGLKNDCIRDIYFRNNIHDIYTKVLDVRNQNKLIRKIIDGNDLLDLCGLEEARSENLLFISTDNRVNRVIDKIYNSEEKEIISLFINFEFSKR